MLIQLSSQGERSRHDLVGLLGECHQRIRRFVRLAHEVSLREDAPPDQVVQACADVERYFVEALPLHVADEEQSIEPRLRGLSAAVDDALDAIAQQHLRHASNLEALLDASAKVRGDPLERAARAELGSAAVALEAEFEEHLALEERVIFPALRGLLTPEIQAAIVDELRQRRAEAMGR